MKRPIMISGAARKVFANLLLETRKVDLSVGTYPKYVAAMLFGTSTPVKNLANMDSNKYRSNNPISVNLLEVYIVFVLVFISVT